MCVHDCVCPFGVWQIAHGSPLGRGDSTGTRLTLGKAVVQGTSLLPVMQGRSAGMRCACGLGPEPARSALVWGGGVFVPVVF